MKKLNCLPALLFFTLIACKKEAKQVERISETDYTVICDSIYSSLPGRMLYKDHIIYWQDVFETEGYMHALNAETGVEMGRFGNIGEGPQEFSLPMIALSANKGIYIKDGVKNMALHYQISEDGKVSALSDSAYQCVENATFFQHLDTDEEAVYLCGGNDRPFEFKRKNGNTLQGKFPFDEKITNGYDVYQGLLEYNASRKALVYSTFEYPYLALYQIDGNQATLKQEVKGTTKYIVKNSELRLDKKQPKGALEIALTKDYIIALQRDEAVEGETPEAKSPRDLATLPRSLFIYDYDLNLKKILLMEFPLLRICGDKETNTIYAMGVNPEFMIIRTYL